MRIEEKKETAAALKVDWAMKRRALTLKEPVQALEEHYFCEWGEKEDPL